jgi:hypothetical protein
MEHCMGLIERTPLEDQYQTGRATYRKRESTVQKYYLENTKYNGVPDRYGYIHDDEKLVLRNCEKTSFCQRKLDRKIITFSEEPQP